MKYFIFEADRTQWEKPTEAKYVFCPPARIKVFAENKRQAVKLAQERAREQFAGTGVLTGTLRLVQTQDEPVDWSYGYGDARSKGTKKVLNELGKACTK